MKESFRKGPVGEMSNLRKVRTTRITEKTEYKEGVMNSKRTYEIYPFSKMEKRKREMTTLGSWTLTRTVYHQRVSLPTYFLTFVRFVNCTT